MYLTPKIRSIYRAYPGVYGLPMPESVVSTDEQSFLSHFSASY
nr:MAG TPA: hypothetical protein [Caudoviricetes sp.]